MMGIKAREFRPIEVMTLDDLVRSDSFYRYLETTPDLSFVRDLVRDHYAASGRPGSLFQIAVGDVLGGYPL
jgi:hypothetical protein